MGENNGKRLTQKWKMIVGRRGSEGGNGKEKEKRETERERKRGRQVGGEVKNGGK